MKNAWRDLVLVCRMIKIEHSIFALPFAYAGMFLAAGGWPGWGPFAALTVAMIAVRSFAMAVNRLVDLDIDRANPRTQTRPLVTGELSRGFTLAFIIITAAIFVTACAFMNRTCLYLAPVALFWSGVYSLTKRFTWLCHFVLGSVLALAPVAGWLCVDPVLTWPAVWLFVGVTFWVAGFDLLYASQDAEFDRSFGLNSIPARFGVGSALTISSISHVITAGAFMMAGVSAGLGWIYFAVAGTVSAILVLEHLLISKDDMSRVNVAFFTMNGVIAVFVFAGVWLDLVI